MAILDGSRFLRSAALRELVSAPGRSVSFFARAWGAAIVVEASLRGLGYKRTVAWIRRQKKPSKKGVSVELGARLVKIAYKAHIFQGGCLPQSLVQYLLHQRDGTPARFVVGVRRGVPAPTAAHQATPRVEAHAWVEGEGEAENGFTPIFQTVGATPGKIEAESDRIS